ncbi:hypothetical protein R1flu_022391 [Riccia fluitans]|uniref:Uncharacterized protein n=1 Tax=Riccia fluitans TaxID=41844 RepID=A0ABD1ZS36_9MARC
MCLLTSAKDRVHFDAFRFRTDGERVSQFNQERLYNQGTREEFDSECKTTGGERDGSFDFEQCLDDDLDDDYGAQTERLATHEPLYLERRKSQAPNDWVVGPTSGYELHSVEKRTWQTNEEKELIMPLH